jgi:NAD(P)-dependent dehydrogenase (short-subunit alcohol dehydrogenase family)
MELEGNIAIVTGAGQGIGNLCLRTREGWSQSGTG